MDAAKLLEMGRGLDKKKKGKKEELETFRKAFERFHLLNRKYVDKETFEQTRGSISAMAEAIANTLQYLDAEIVRLRNKRAKLPFENVELAEMQKAQKKNEVFIKEVLADFTKKGPISP